MVDVNLYPGQQKPKNESGKVAAAILLMVLAIPLFIFLMPEKWFEDGQEKPVKVGKPTEKQEPVKEKTNPVYVLVLPTEKPNVFENIIVKEPPKWEDGKFSATKLDGSKVKIDGFFSCQKANGVKK